MDKMREFPSTMVSCRQSRQDYNTPFHSPLSCLSPSIHITTIHQISKREHYLLHIQLSRRILDLPWVPYRLTDLILARDYCQSSSTSWPRTDQMTCLPLFPSQMISVTDSTTSLYKILLLVSTALPFGWRITWAKALRLRPLPILDHVYHVTSRLARIC